MAKTKKTERQPEGTVRPGIVPEAQRRIVTNFYDREDVIEIAVREMLRDVLKAA